MPLLRMTELPWRHFTKTARPGYVPMTMSLATAHLRTHREYHACDRRSGAELEQGEQHQPASRGAQRVHGHSARSDDMGSTRAARLAGAQLARAATPSSRAETAPKVSGSVALTWKRVAFAAWVTSSG